MCSPRSTMWPTSPTLSTARWAGGGDDGGDDGDDDDIYIMMSVCVSVCHEKSSLPPWSLL